MKVAERIRLAQLLFSGRELPQAAQQQLFPPTAPSPLEASLEKFKEQLELALAETNRRRDSAATRAAATTSRATILIGVSSIVTGFKIAEPLSTWSLLALGAALLAAVAGAVALFPRSGIDLDLVRGHEVWPDMGINEMRLDIINHKILAIIKEETAQRWRAHCVRVGFVLLTLAVVFTFVNILIAASIGALPALQSAS